MTAPFPIAEAMQRVQDAKTGNFVELIKLAGLDPKRHLRFSQWSGIDFSGCNLDGYDFSGACLRNCKFEGAFIEGARFDQAEINGSNLRAAKDWKRHVKGWRKAASLPPDSHLPVGAVFQDAPFAPEMVVIPPGAFMIGSPDDEPERYDDEGPRHEVTIPKGLAVGRYTVTFEEWDAAVAESGLSYKPKDQGWGRGRCPVINVSWNDAQAYINWLRQKTGQPYRLLSEAEWEYACRAGTTTPFWWGSSITPAQANYEGNYAYKGGGSKGEYCAQTLPVESFEPNPWGLYQVHGNVWEWCEDVWEDSYEYKPYDLNLTGAAWATGDSGRRVLRGGSWLDLPRDLRAAYRGRGIPVSRFNYAGFRLARTLNP